MPDPHYGHIDVLNTSMERRVYCAITLSHIKKHSAELNQDLKGDDYVKFFLSNYP